MVEFDQASESELSEWQVEEIQNGLAEADRGEFASKAEIQRTLEKWNHPTQGPMIIRLPEPVTRIYEAITALEALYPNRNFTPDGHLVGSLGEVIAAEALGLTLYPMSRPGHDAYDAKGDVQIKMTAGKSIAMYASCERLVVLKVISPREAEIVYDGPGQPAWENAGKMGKNGQRLISLFRLRKISLEP
jgi:uncharacterized protein DUF6998